MKVAAVKFVHVDKVYGGVAFGAFGRSSATRVALQDATFDLPFGAILGVLGANGAGKSTVLRLSAGLLPATCGTVEVCGGLPDVLTRTPLAALVLSDERSFNWRLTVGDNLRTFARLHGLPRVHESERILQLMQTYGLTEVSAVPFHNLSSGLRQRVALCRGLLSDPQIVLLDEPTKALDPIAASEFRTILRYELLKDAGASKAVIVASHNLEEVREIADLLVVLVAGRITFFGPTSDFTGWRTRNLKIAVSAAPLGLSTLGNGPGPEAVLISGRNGAEIIVPDPSNPRTLSTVFGLVAASGTSMRSISTDLSICWHVVPSPDSSREGSGSVDWLPAESYPEKEASRKSAPMMSWRCEVRRVVALIYMELKEVASYRLALGLKVVSVLLAVAGLVAGGRIAALHESTVSMVPVGRSGGLVFVAVGLMGATAGLGAMRSVPGRIRKSQVQGLLEAIVATGASPRVLAMFVLGVQAMATFGLVIAYTCLMIVVPGRVEGTIVLSALTLCVVGLPAFLGLGLGSAGFVLVFKVGDPLTAIHGIASVVLSGVFVPIAYLPPWAKLLAHLLPLTYLLESLRECLSYGFGGTFLVNVGILTGMSSICGVFGWCMFMAGFKRAMREGSLSQY